MYARLVAGDILLSGVKSSTEITLTKAFELSCGNKPRPHRRVIVFGYVCHQLASLRHYCRHTVVLTPIIYSVTLTLSCSYTN